MQSAVSAQSEKTIRSDMFDEVLLCHWDRVRVLWGAMPRQSRTKESDLRTLLVDCARAVAADDRRTANELLKQIRKSSSPFGDGSQRLAHCFADGLEARLAGTGCQIYQSLLINRSATDVLNFHQLYWAACPFERISHFYSNVTILNATEKAERVHIIDFGIGHGFQWPILIQWLSMRPGGPPRLRITGIDVPQPGFRPMDRIEEAGKRLADYARSFDVPFEYRAIATSKWEEIEVEDLEIADERDGVVVVVNCLYRLRNLSDETVAAAAADGCPRNRVLESIRKAEPDVFVHGVLNGTYSAAPFFVTRFREALFHYSALFDMLDANLPREDPQRLLGEREIFGAEAANAVACEGPERVERPESYKRWQVRNLGAGFRQLPLNPEIARTARDEVKRCYHKDFVIDEDGRWLLQGWKGRIIYALSTWKPNKYYYSYFY